MTPPKTVTLWSVTGNTYGHRFQEKADKFKGFYQVTPEGATLPRPVAAWFLRELGRKVTDKSPT